MNEEKKVRYMVFDGDDITGEADMPAGLLAHVDQQTRQVDELISKLVSRHVSVLLAASDGNDEATREGVREAMALCMELERAEAISVLNSLAAQVARAFVMDHGGPTAVLARLNDGQDHCCDKHIPRDLNDPFPTND